jgi:hypothetical protein
MAMDKEERKVFELMSKAQKEMSRALERVAATQEEMTRVQERLVDAVEKQQPSKVAQVLTTAAAIATTIGGLCVVDVIINWLKGG